MRGALIHGALLAVMLVYGYRTWTRDTSIQPDLGSVVLWDKTEADLVSVEFRTERVINKLERQERWVEREADKVLADEHKADQMLGGDRNAQPAQTPDPQALAAVLADLQAQKAELEQQAMRAQLEQEAAALRSKVPSTQAIIELVSNLVYAQVDMLRMIALLSPTSP